VIGQLDIIKNILKDQIQELRQSGSKAEKLLRIASPLLLDVK
jgi:hypothetical protein